jgi:hypothetical protein
MDVLRSSLTTNGRSMNRKSKDNLLPDEEKMNVKSLFGADPKLPN